MMVSGKVLGVVGGVATKVGGAVGKSLGIQCASFLSSRWNLAHHPLSSSHIQWQDSHRHQGRRSQVPHRLQRRHRFARDWVSRLALLAAAPTNAASIPSEARRYSKQERTLALQSLATS